MSRFMKIHSGRFVQRESCLMTHFSECVPIIRVDLTGFDNMAVKSDLEYRNFKRMEEK